MDTSDWVYRGEGNSSLVIANTKTNRVFKLRKKKVVVKCDTKDPKSSDSEGKLQLCRRMLQYSEGVLRPLLGEEVVPIAEIVPVSVDFLKGISEKVRKLRPAKRLDTEVDEESEYAISLPDLCSVQPSDRKNTNPVFCVEIKPKMGFLPDCKPISEERSIKKTACKFCMYQKLKLEFGTWDSASLYCPIDLFSGNEERMMYALSCLIKTPQNNLRIFMNGQLIFSNNGQHTPTSQDRQRLTDLLKSQFGSSSENKDGHNSLNHSCLLDFLHLIQTVLIATEGNIEVKRPQTTNQCLESQFKPSGADKVNNSLPVGCILDRILNVQRLDDLDIEGIYPLYQQLQEHISQHPEDREKYSLEGPFNEHFIDQLPMMTQVTRNNSTKETIDYAVQKIREFLIAATTKDCSIMVTMQRTTNAKVEDASQHISSGNGNLFKYHCNIVDLDPKPSIRIPMYYQLDQDITQHYKKYREQKNLTS